MQTGKNTIAISRQAEGVYTDWLTCVSPDADEGVYDNAFWQHERLQLQKL